MENIKNHEYWSKKTYLIVSNNLKTLNYCDKVIYMHKGRIQFFGTPEKFKKTEQYEGLACIENEEEDSEAEQSETQEQPLTKRVNQKHISSFFFNFSENEF